MISPVTPVWFNKPTKNVCPKCGRNAGWQGLHECRPIKKE